MANVIINPQSGILEFNTGTAGSSVFDNSFSGAARLTFNTGEVNLKSYATGVLDRFTVDGSQGRLFSVSDSLTGSIFSVNDIAGLPIIEVNSTTTDIVNIGTYGTNALVVSGSGIGMGIAAPTAKLDIRDTWNNAATTFTAVKADVTDTSSNAASLLMDLRVGGTSRFSVRKDGGFYSTSTCQIGTTTTPYWQATGSESGAMTLGASYSLCWRSTNPVNTGGNDLFLLRDAAGILAQRNGTNAQIFRLYNTYTDASNYERGFFRWNSNVLQIGTEKLGTGTARALEFQTDGITRMTIATNGVLSTTTHATFAGYVAPSYLRLTGGTGEARIYKGTGDGSFAFYNLAETSRCIINVATDGVLKVRNIGNTDYAVADAQHRLQGTAPTSATDTGTAGDIRYDADYIYICIATNTWKRAAIATWP